MKNDFYYQEFLSALRSDGWKITHDPYEIHIDGLMYAIDFGAERLIGAEKGNEKIAVELKSFVGPSSVNEFHRTIGQFVDYLVALEEVDETRILFVAIPEIAFETFFQKPIIQKALKRVQAKLIIFNPNERKIISWIN